MWGGGTTDLGLEAACGVVGLRGFKQAKAFNRLLLNPPHRVTPKRVLLPTGLRPSATTTEMCLRTTGKLSLRPTPRRQRGNTVRLMRMGHKDDAGPGPGWNRVKAETAAPGRAGAKKWPCGNVPFGTVTALYGLSHQSFTPICKSRYEVQTDMVGEHSML